MTKGVMAAAATAAWPRRRHRAVGSPVVSLRHVVSLGLVGLFAAMAAAAAPPAGDGEGGPQPMHRPAGPATPLLVPFVPPQIWSDCNGDGVNDRAGSWPDCDGDGQVDWCQVAQSPSADCDGDGVLDVCELATGEADCNGNGVLDECEPQFMLPEYEVDPPEGGWPDDCNVNRIADRLEICRDPDKDCDGNGMLDECEIGATPILDCDRDGVLDECQLRDDPGLDCDGNGVLDRCERSCVEIGVGGPNYLGDGDFGSWYVGDLPPGCAFVGAYVLDGPIQIARVDFPRIDIGADVLAPGATQPASFRVVVLCNGCECAVDVPLTVQAYDRIWVELRAFIPCELVFATDFEMQPAWFVGDCRDFDCGETTLPTDVFSPSSRALVGADFRMTLAHPASNYSGLNLSQRCMAGLPRDAADFSQCGGNTVPVGDDLTNCEWQCAGGLLAPCPAPPGATAGTSTVIDKSAPGAPFNDVNFVGSPRQREVDLRLAARNTCIQLAPAIDAHAMIAFAQRCDPSFGMQPVRYDAWLLHDYFPAYELVARNISVCTSGSNCMAKVTPTVGPLGLTLVTEMDPVPPTPTGPNGRPALVWQTNGWRVLP